MNSKKNFKIVKISVSIFLLISCIVYINYKEKYNEEQYKTLISEAERELDEEAWSSARATLARAKKFSNKHSDEILKLTDKANEMELDEEINYIKRTLVSKERYSTSQWDTIGQFIIENKNNDKVKNDLSKFVLEKWKGYIKSSEKNEDIEFKLTSTLRMLKDAYPENQEVSSVYSNYSYNESTKEVAQQKQETKVTRNLVSEDGNLELVSHNSSDGYIKGTIKNNSNSKYRYTEVNINLYDKNGNQVGNTLANINNLEPYKTWNFEAVVLENNVASYKILNIKSNY